MIRYVLLVLAVYAVIVLAACYAAHGQATQPAANDRLIYLRADGGYIELKPADDRWPVANRDVSGATLSRPDGSRGEWIAATRPAIAPATAPATLPTLPTTVPVLDSASPIPTTVPSKPSGIHVAPGQSWAAAVRQAKPGDTVWLAAGGVWTEALTDQDLQLQRVTIAVYGDGPATIRVPQGSALVLYRPRDVRIDGVRFEADQPSGAGVRIFGGERVTLNAVTVTNHTFGVTVEAYGKQRSADVTLSRCDLSDNWHPQNGDSSGMFASGTDRLTIDSCRFAGNGWREGKAKGSIRNHGQYTAGDCSSVRVTACLFERNSSHGMQARAGGIVEACTFVDNPIHLSYGLVNGGGPIVPGGVTGSIKGNTFTGTRPLAGEPRGWAIEVGNVKDAEILGNTFTATHTFDPKREVVAAIKLDVCRLSDEHPQAARVVRILTLRIDGNRATWPGGPLWLGAKASALTVQSEWPER